MDGLSGARYGHLDQEDVKGEAPVVGGRRRRGLFIRRASYWGERRSRDVEADVRAGGGRTKLSFGHVHDDRVTGT